MASLVFLITRALLAMSLPTPSLAIYQMTMHALTTWSETHHSCVLHTMALSSAFLTRLDF